YCLLNLLAGKGKLQVERTNGKGKLGGPALRDCAMGRGLTPVSTGWDAAAGAAQATGGGGRKPPAWSYPRMAAKRKLDVINSAPSPRGPSRTGGLKNAETHKARRSTRLQSMSLK
ncbi:unnamed protein product, partial [Urochloa humidicola]